MVEEDYRDNRSGAGAGACGGAGPTRRTRVGPWRIRKIATVR